MNKQVDSLNEKEKNNYSGFGEDDFDTEEKEICIISDVENLRIDVYLAEKLHTISRSFIQKLIDQGSITVNERKIKSNYKIKVKDIIKIIIPPPEIVEVEAENIPLDIVYEDQDLAVINKPQGMVVHPAPGHYSGTLVNGLLYYMESLSSINGDLRPGIVHRLDKDTSGLMLVAKNDQVHKFLAQSLKAHSIKRVYYALVEGNVKDPQGVINAPLGRSEKDRKKRAVTSKNSKEAITEFQVVKGYGRYTLLELKLQTGRTHQIRVHTKYIGHPVVGDTVYGSKSNKFGLEGQLLHSKKLGFVHPTSNNYMEFESELPDYFLKVLKIIKT